MRATQPYGLPKSAESFLREHAIRKNVCDHCNRDDGFTRQQIGTYGMFDEYELWRYLLNDGRTADEGIQETIWSSGPMVWLELVVSDGTKISWDKKDIDK